MCSHRAWRLGSWFTQSISHRKRHWNFEITDLGPESNPNLSWNSPKPNLNRIWTSSESNLLWIWTFPETNPNLSWNSPEPNQKWTIFSVTYDHTVLITGIDSERWLWKIVNRDRIWAPNFHLFYTWTSPLLLLKLPFYEPIEAKINRYGPMSLQSDRRLKFTAIFIFENTARCKSNFKSFSHGYSILYYDFLIEDIERFVSSLGQNGIRWFVDWGLKFRTIFDFSEHRRSHSVFKWRLSFQIPFQTIFSHWKTDIIQVRLSNRSTLDFRYYSILFSSIFQNCLLFFFINSWKNNTINIPGMGHKR